MEKSKRNIVYEVSLEIEHTGSCTITSGTSVSYPIILANLKNKLFMKKLLNNFSFSRKEDQNLIGYYIDKIRKKLNISRKELYEASLISKSYFYKIIKGDSHPSRDIMIQLALSLGLNLNETNLLLKKANYNELYLRNKRDMIIASNLENNSNLIDTNEELESFQINLLGANYEE
ncbi:hypothetical protein COJ93_11715 [Bacillus anthracis]|nr:hypothetical protein CON33_25005 [Bacillus anthracis]PFP36916.1 hypothetical protein COJ93_11715 [Bacillus anthracis]